MSLETARIVRSHRRIEDDALIRDYGRMLRLAIETRVPVEIPGEGPSLRFAAEMRGAALLAKVTSTATGADLVTIAIGLEDFDGIVLWRQLHSDRSLATSADACPPAPWCAVREERGVAEDLASAEWLEEFARGLAWACVA